MKRLCNTASRRTALVCKTGAVAACLGPLSPALAQEGLRVHTANEQALAGRRQAASTVGYYNLRLGRTLWTLTSGLGITYTDNVNAGGVGFRGGGAGTGSGGDLLLQPQMGVQLRAPVTTQNSLDVSMSGGYVAYTRNPNYGHLFISQGSGVSFDLSVGQVLFNFYDRPSISQYAYQDPTATGSGDYVRFQNDAGLSASWNMNRLVLNSGFNYALYGDLNSGTPSGSSTGSGNSQSLFFSAGYAPRTARIFGLETGVGFINYDSSIGGPSSTNSVRSGTQSSFGAFYYEQLTDYIQLRAHVGYTVFSLDLPAGVPGKADTGSLYYTVGLNHRINERIEHSLNAGQTTSANYSGGAYKTDSITWGASFKFIHKMPVSTSISYSQYTQPTSLGGATGSFNYLTTSISVSRALSEKVSSSLTYQFLLRDSPQGSPSAAGFAYTANTFTLSFNYRF